MTRSLFSPSWYRVAGLKPRLRSHVEIHRHHYRGDLWYILQDHSSGKYHRFTPAAYLLIGLMDGQRTVDEIWEAGRVRLGEDAPTQEEMIQLLSQLHAVDALQADVVPDTRELLERSEKQRHTTLKQNLRSPLFMRFPLLDPERFLVRLLPLVRPFFSWFGVLLWLGVVGTAVFLAGVHLPELTRNVTDRILAPRNLVLLWLTFPFVKALHEFGHAFATKVWGGEVHEMGIMLLVLTPIPYMDASSALAFREKRKRVLVGALGMIVELFVASLALFIWLNAEPGTFRAVMYNVVLIASVSTVLFNGNPLLRYDSYYILSDLLEIPNLGTRGMQYMSYLLQRYLFGVPEAEPPLSTSGERFWFVLYTIASFIYRIFIYTAIILFIAGKFFIVGMLMAAWAVVTMVILPAGKAIKFLASSPKLGRKRTRAVVTSALALAIVVALVALVPVPLSTQAEGVIWIPEKSYVRAGTDGFVERILTRTGSFVRRGEPLIECSDPLLPAEIKVLESRLRELKTIFDTEIISDRVKAEMTKEEIEQVTAELERARERAEELIIVSPSSGKLLVPMSEDLPGRFVKRGELLAYVVDRATVSARVVVSQADVDFVRQRTLRVDVRLPETVSVIFPAVLKREMPAATDQLPSRTLSQEGGGDIAIDPRDMMGVKAFQKVFLFDLEMPVQARLYNVGGRVYVRFDHGREPLVYRWYRAARKLFLRRFNV
jgi:putative peptide zinc metalloprotease protein